MVNQWTCGRVSSEHWTAGSRVLESGARISKLLSVSSVLTAAAAPPQRCLASVRLRNICRDDDTGGRNVATQPAATTAYRAQIYRYKRRYIDISVDTPRDGSIYGNYFGLWPVLVLVPVLWTLIDPVLCVWSSPAQPWCSVH